MRWILFIFSFILLFELPAYGQTVTIYRAGSAISPVYTTIKSAVAATVAGDSLILNGIFWEHRIEINKTLSITGIGSSIIDARAAAFSDAGPALIVTNAAYATTKVTIYLKDITIANAYAVYGRIRRGAAIYADTGVNIILDGSTSLQDNNSISSPSYLGGEFGGAVYCRGDVVMKGHSKITNNKIDIAGGGIYATGSVTLMDHAVCSNNSAAREAGGGIYCGGRLTIQDHAIVSGNYSTNGGGIYAVGVMEIRDSVLISHNAGYGNGAGIYCADTIRISDGVHIDSNGSNGNGGGIYSAKYCSVTGNVILKGNTAVNGGGIYHSGAASLSGNMITDSNRATENGGGIFSNGSLTMMDSTIVSGNSSGGFGGGIYLNAAALTMRNSSVLAFNRSKKAGAGIFMKKGSLSMNDSCVVALNLTDTSYGAAICSKAADINIKGGQIIGNRCSYDTVQGHGMAIYVDSAAGFLPVVAIRNVRIFNPSRDTVQQNEIYNMHPGLSFSSDTTWWGDSDTAGVFQQMTDTGFHLGSWVVADWSVNGGLPVGITSSFPVNAAFTLNTGAVLPTYMFWMLAGRFAATAGAFTPALSWMIPSNNINSLYTVPASSATVRISGIVDADSFDFVSAVTGLNIPRNTTASNFLVYPNPSDGIIYIQQLTASGLQSQVGPAMSATVYDLCGRVVLRRPLQPNSTTIELPPVPGIYILELEDEQGNIERKKIILTHLK